MAAVRLRRCQDAPPLPQSLRILAPGCISSHARAPTANWPASTAQPAPRQHTISPYPPAAPARSPAAAAASPSPCAAAAPSRSPSCAPCHPCAAASCRAAGPCCPRCHCWGSVSGGGGAAQAIPLLTLPRRLLAFQPAPLPGCRCRSHCRCWRAAAGLPPHAAAGLQDIAVRRGALKQQQHGLLLPSKHVALPTGPPCSAFSNMARHSGCSAAQLPTPPCAARCSSCCRCCASKKEAASKLDRPRVQSAAPPLPPGGGGGGPCCSAIGADQALSPIWGCCIDDLPPAQAEPGSGSEAQGLMGSPGSGPAWGELGALELTATANRVAARGPRPPQTRAAWPGKSMLRSGRPP